MNERLSRRELIAWLAAATGAGVAGASVLTNRPQPTVGAAAIDTTSTTGTTPGTTSSPATTMATAPAAVTSEANNLNGRWSQLTPAPVDQRILVVVEFPGGNDGMSTEVPYGLPGYYDLRSTTAIAEAEVLGIDDEVGLHPALGGVQQLGVSMVEGVGSTEPNGSHFEMLARWWGGRSRVIDADTGWIGRCADLLHDGSVPATTLSIGSGAHPIQLSTQAPTLSLPSIDALWSVSRADEGDVYLQSLQRGLDSFTNQRSGTAATDRYRSELANIRGFGQRLYGVDDGDLEALGYDWGFGQGLHLAATIAAADVGIRIVHVQLPGDFDTHDGHTWRHPELMASFDRNIVAFHTELANAGLADRVAVMTTSEFGRTPRENGSEGLDHGTASTALVLGPGAAGRHGSLPSLTSFDDNDDLITSVPFERYLGGMTESWLGLPSTELFGQTEDLVRPLG